MPNRWVLSWLNAFWMQALQKYWLKCTNKAMMVELHPRILVTRPVAQAAGQSELLRQQGADPVELPLLEIIPTAEDDSGYPC